MKHYVKSLDTIRAIAVTIVIYYHWINGGVTKIIPWGPIGVEMFFTLSGFLITSILLQSRDKIDSGYSSRRQAFKQFYIRRSLRIFPIYYLYIAIIFFGSAYLFSDIKVNIGWYLTYTQNILFYKTNYFDELLAHLWTLAVEEQFYLFWPAIIFFLPKKAIGWSIGFIAIIGVITQYITIRDNAAPLLTYQCMDCFGLGGLLAYLQGKKRELNVLITALLVIGTLATILILFNFFFDTPLIITRRTSVAIFTTLIIAWLIRRQDRGRYFLKNFWENPVLNFIGKISYGMYMYHLLLFYVVRGLNVKFLNQSFDEALQIMRHPVYFLALYFSLILISWLSFHLFEMKFLNLKDRFTKTITSTQAE